MKNKKIVSLLAARAMAVSSSSAVYADQTAVEVPFSSIPGILVGNVSDTETDTKFCFTAAKHKKFCHGNIFMFKYVY